MHDSKEIPISMLTQDSALAVMVVDNEINGLRALIKILERENIRVISTHAQDALCFLREKEPDLLLLNTDIHMRLGLKLINVIKARYPELPILIVTSDGAYVPQKAMERLGAKGFIYAPFYRHIILDKLSLLFNERRKRNDN